MLENEVNKHSELHPSSSSSSEVTDYETDNADKERVYDEVYKAILDELVDDAMWELCFEVHKAVKLGYFFLDPDPEKKKYLEEAEKDIFGQRLKSKVPTYQISCPICKNKSCATKYASHLAKCIGISGRNSSRAATRKMAADLDENDSDSDSSVSASRKKSKKTHGKKTQKKSKVRGLLICIPPHYGIRGNIVWGSSSKTSLENANFEDMTHEERKQFFKQKCGVITKTNKMCMNSHKCSQHTDEEKREIRHCLLRDMGEMLTSDGQIDVDTVDEGNFGYFFS